MTQEHNYGCAVAWLAFVSNLSYKEVVRRLRRRETDQPNYYCKELVNFLQTLGLPYAYNYLKPGLRRKIYQEGVIVYIK